MKEHWLYIGCIKSPKVERMSSFIYLEDHVLVLIKNKKKKPIQTFGVLFYTFGLHSLEEYKKKVLRYGITVATHFSSYS